MNCDWRAWEVTCCGIVGVAIARTRGRARYLAARAAAEVGYAKTSGEALLTIKCRRAPEYDAGARTVDREALRTAESLTSGPKPRPQP